MSKVLYPGSFDPITKGHMDIIDQSKNLFDEVIIAVLHNPLKKTGMFTLEERTNMISKLYENVDNIKIVMSDKAAVDVAIENGCSAIVRGIRGLSDYSFEVQLCEMNKDISNNRINTVCLFASKEYQFISSSAVKEVLSIGKPIDKYVDPYVAQELYHKRKIQNEK